MNRPVVDAGEVQIGGATRTPFLTEYDVRGGYLDHHRQNVFSFKDASIEPDANGIPMNNYRWGGPYYYIVTVGHFGLQCLSRHIVLKEEGALDQAHKVVAWLKANEAPGGGWTVPYDHDWYPGRTEKLKTPWHSAMGLGLSMSFLARMRLLTKDKSLLPIIEGAAKPFTIPSEKGGVLARYHGLPWYEEYPTKPSSFVLNGYIYSLLGLYDAATVTKSPLIWRLYNDGIDSLTQMLSLFDLGWGTAYDLTHHMVPGAAPNTARWQYHWLHVMLLSALGHIETDRFKSYAERWHQYQFGGHVRQN